MAGYFLITLFLAGVIASIHLDHALMCLLSILGTVATAMTTLNPVTWVYMPEVLNDKQFSFACTVHYLGGMLLSTTTEPLVTYLEPAGAFAVFGGISAAMLLFVVLFVRETSGLSDIEKKNLYARKKDIDDAYEEQLSEGRLSLQ